MLIKYHGSYQQDDRDIREERRQQKLEPAYSFMIRTRTPGGVVTPAQWLKLDAIATTYAERGLRITTRQAFQFHGVIKARAEGDDAGDQRRADRHAGRLRRRQSQRGGRRQSAGVAPCMRRCYAQAAALSEHLLPNTRAYYEIWLDEEAASPAAARKTSRSTATAYLPRKFKIGFAIPPVNDVDVFAQDLGFIAIIEAGELLGYNVSIGGGMGATHGDAETYPRIGDVIGFITPDQVIALANAVVTAQRDFGNRVVRKRARLKYTIDDRGLDWFKAEVERRAGFALAPARAFVFDHNGDRFGWVEGEDGRWHLTLRLLSGRIWDRDGSVST